MILQDLLLGKGANVQSIGPTATLVEAVTTLAQHNIGSLLVCEREADGTQRLLGILTERDVLRLTATRRHEFDRLLVCECMSKGIITGRPEDSVESAMGLMTERRIRHLPILDAAGQLCGIVSIGDIVKAQHKQMALENHYLKSYLHG